MTTTTAVVHEQYKRGAETQREHKMQQQLQSCHYTFCFGKHRVTVSLTQGRLRDYVEICEGCVLPILPFARYIDTEQYRYMYKDLPHHLVFPQATYHKGAFSRTTPLAEADKCACCRNVGSLKASQRY